MRSGRLRGVLVTVAMGAILGDATLAESGEPYDLQTGREIALSTAGIGMLGTARLLGHGTEPLSETEIAALRLADLPAIDRGAARRWSPGAAEASDWLQGIILASPAIVFLDSGPQGNITPLTVSYLQTLALNNGTVGLLKTLVARTRPYLYNPDPTIDLASKQRPFARRSFPSGHAANAFAGAMFLGEVYSTLHPDRSSRHWVRYGALSLAAVTGYLRYAAGVHFPSDILAGAAIGSAIGWLVPHLHESDGEPSGGPSAGASFAFGFAF